MTFQIQVHRSGVQAGFLPVASVAAAIGVWVTGAGLALAPMPAQTTAPLSGTTGATAAAVTVEIYQSSVVKWPNSLTPCPSTILAGTSCSNSALAPDVLAYQKIFRIGSNCKCDSGVVSPSTVQTTLLLAPLASANGSTAAGIRANVKDTAVILWPTTWHAHVNNAVPEPGTPCSPTAMAAGQRTFRHIQGYVNNTSTYRRCVPNTEPLWSPP